MAYADAGLRATSMVLSAALLGGALLAAMTMRFAMMQTPPPPDFSAVEMVRPIPPLKPPEPPQPIIQRPMADAIVIIDTATLPPIESEPPMPTEAPVAFSETRPPVVSDPHWTRRPRDLSRFYPARARSLGIEGEVTLDCVVSTQGALGCVVARETPPGWGFGDSAIRIAREHRMVPATQDGRPVEARYRMRLPFHLD